VRPLYTLQYCTTVHNDLSFCLMFLLNALYDVQPLPWDSKDKEIFTMLDDICIANKRNPLSMSSSMATVT
jgi:hypothetical protein